MEREKQGEQEEKGRISVKKAPESKTDVTVRRALPGTL
jgi:hypothetical protein